MNKSGMVKSDREKQDLAKATGLSVEQMDPFVTVFKGQNGEIKPYIGKDGRRYKMDERFGAGKWRAKTALPSVEECTVLMRMWGIKQGEPCIIMKCEISVDGDVLATDYGTARPHNMLAGQKQFEARGIEIATTRAINRAMGQLVAGGFADPNNTYQGKGDPGYSPIPESPQGRFRVAMQHLKGVVGEEAYRAVLREHGFEKSNDPKLMTDPETMQQVYDEMCIQAQPVASDALFGDAPHVEDAPAYQIDAPEVEAEPAEESPEPELQDEPGEAPQFVDEEGAEKLIRFAGQFGIPEKGIIEHIASQYGCERITELRVEQYPEVRMWVQGHKPVEA